MDFEGSPPPVPWICDNVAARGCLTVLAGEAGQGKSWLALALAKGVSEGKSAAGIPCTRGTVMYVDAENGFHEMHRRVRSMKLNGECEVYLAEGFDLGLNQAGLAHYLAVTKPSLLILDGLRSLWPTGDENDSAGTSIMLNQLRIMLQEYEVSAILIHHLNKLGNYRGSSAIAAEPEILVHMYRKRESNVRYLKWKKCRMGHMPSPHEFSMVNDNMGNIQLIAEG